MPKVGVIGAGTMGGGIAQVAAAAGWDVVLLDQGIEAARRGIDGIARGLDRAVEKAKLTAAARDQQLTRIHPIDSPEGVAGCSILIEAVFEDLDVKARTLLPLVKAAPPACIVASNTSSLSITNIGRAIQAGPRTVGMHFFNPVPMLPLVEVISGEETRPEVADQTAQIAREWGKSPVRAKDTPGFIVNRVARGYYLESLRILDEGIAGVDEIDQTLKSMIGFRMGPFELMDLIGIDVNYAVSCSVWEQLGRPARLTPHPLQKSLVEKKHFGRKSKIGYFSYQTEHPVPALIVDRKSFDAPPGLYAAVRRFADGATKVGGSWTEQYIFARVLATVINEAALARDEGVATAADIDTAMKLGTNYPRGPLEWAEEIGPHTVAGLLRTLNETVTDNRFEPARGLG